MLGFHVDFTTKQAKPGWFGCPFRRSEVPEAITFTTCGSVRLVTDFRVRRYTDLPGRPNRTESTTLLRGGRDYSLHLVVNGVG